MSLYPGASRSRRMQDHAAKSSRPNLSLCSILNLEDKLVYSLVRLHLDIPTVSEGRRHHIVQSVEQVKAISSAMGAPSGNLNALCDCATRGKVVADGLPKSWDKGLLTSQSLAPV